MAVMFGALYKALLEAHVTEAAAQEAAEELAGYEHRFAKIDERFAHLEGRMTLLQWMVGTNVVLTIGVLVRLLTQ